MVIDRLADMVSIINTSLVAREQYVTVKKNRENIQILYILYRNGIIKGFHIGVGRIIIFLKFLRERSVLRKLKRFPGHNRRMQWALKQWNDINYKNSFGGFYIASIPITQFGWLNYKSGHFDLGVDRTTGGGIIRLLAKI